MVPPPSSLLQDVNPSPAGSSFVRYYIGVILLFSSLLIIAIFWNFHTRTNSLLRDQLLHEARAFFQEIVKTRSWIIQQQGVYVQRRPDSHVQPTIASIPGLKTTIQDREGNSYLLRGHAEITRMISRLGQEERLFTINITSLNPLNPENEPDPFERAALRQFEDGIKEISRFEKNAGGVVFRYMAPLRTEKACLGCHGLQGYEIGDIRGGISISIPANSLQAEMNTTLIFTIFGALIILTLLISVVVYISRLFIRRLKRSEERLVQLATTDSLTSLLNRREGIRRFQQEISLSIRRKMPLSVIILDIDNFKMVNDNYGHQAGDLVIMTIADILHSTLRNYDIICRYGGEEYLVVLPATELQKALETAERLRKIIEDTAVDIQKNAQRVKITASFGVTSLAPDDSLDGLVYRADNALYIAKEEGRNLVRFID